MTINDDVISRDTWTDHLTDTDGHTTNGGRVWGVTPYRYADCDRYGCKSAVVIDPEDARTVATFALLYAAQDPGDVFPKMQAALREFANPTPPKPDEPTGLGAVVEDANGVRWVRMRYEFNKNWCASDEVGTRAHWDAIKVVRVLSEGIQ